MYKQNTPPEKFTEAKYQKLAHNGDKASHIVTCLYAKGQQSKHYSTGRNLCRSRCCKNILLGAEALDIAVLWSTSGLTMQL